MQAPPDLGDGRRRLLAQRPDHRRRQRVFNKDDGVLIVMQNGYTSATGQQDMPSSADEPRRARRPAWTSSRRCRAFGVQWLRTVRTYSVATMVDDAEGGDEHRRRRASRSSSPTANASSSASAACAPRIAAKLKAGERVVRTQVRRRRRDLHRRPLLHPPLRLPVAHREAQPRSAAHRSGRRRERRAASAAGCAARSRTPRCCARRSIAPRSIQNASALGPLAASRAPRGDRLARAARGRAR